MKTTQLITATAIIATLLLVATPVSASPKNVYSFEQQVQLNALYVLPGTEITDGNMLQVKGAESVGNVATPGLDLSGTYQMRLSGFYDLETGTGAFQGKWEIRASNGGEFSGIVIGETTTVTDPYGFQVSGVFIGFGSGTYANDRIKGTFEGEMVAGSLTLNLQLTGVYYDRTK